MAREILNAKLRELEDRIGRLCSRIELSESGTREEIRAEAEQLRKEFEENDRALRDRMRFSRSDMVDAFSEAYEDLEAVVEKMRQKLTVLEERAAEGETGREAAEDRRTQETEERILMAEYSLDFALQSVDRALLASMEAIDSELELEAEAEK